MTLQERAKIAMELLAKQPPVTLEQARAQAQRVKERCENSIKKTRPESPQTDKPTE
jgi:hypothetical protein